MKIIFQKQLLFEVITTLSFVVVTLFAAISCDNTDTHPKHFILHFVGERVSIEPQTILQGECATTPENPEREGYGFSGWFTDNGTFVNEWDFKTDIVTQDTTLYAKWEENVNDPKHLIGEWDAIKFAYTADGKYISDVVSIKSAFLDIEAAPTDTLCEVYDPETGMSRKSKMWVLHSSINGGGWLCSLSGNLIELTFCGSIKIGGPDIHEEWDLVWAFDHAKSFVIKGNELIIFFTGDEENKKFISIAGDEKINLLILKKR